VLPPASAGSGGGSGTAELDWAAEVCGADDVELDAEDDVADEVADEEADVVADDVADDVADVVDDELVDVLDLVVAEVCVAGDCGLCRSVQDSERMVSPLILTFSDCAVTV
jgi:hypothetical protein